MFDMLESHMEHALVVAKYGNENIAIECEDCCEVLIDFDKEDS